MLQDDDVDTVHLAAAIFLFDGRANESAFELMQREGAFSRLVEFIGDRRDDDSGLHRMLLELLFEMARIQKLSKEELGMLDCCVVRVESDSDGSTGRRCFRALSLPADRAAVRRR